MKKPRWLSKITREEWLLLGRLADQRLREIRKIWDGVRFNENTIGKIKTGDIPEYIQQCWRNSLYLECVEPTLNAPLSDMPLYINDYLDYNGIGLRGVVARWRLKIRR